MANRTYNFTKLTLKAIPRTISSVFAPKGGPASPWALSPKEDVVDILEEEASEEDIEEKLGYSTEDVEDKGGAEDTESFEVDEVELPFEMVRLVDFSVTSMTSIGGCSFVGLIWTEATDAEASSAALTASNEDIQS